MLVGLASAKAEQKVKESCCSEKSGKTWHGSFQTPAQVCCVIRVTIRWTGVFRIYPPRTWTPRREVVEMLGLARKGMSGTAARSGRTLNMRFNLEDTESMMRLAPPPLLTPLVSRMYKEVLFGPNRLTPGAGCFNFFLRHLIFLCSLSPLREPNPS